MADKSLTLGTLFTGDAKGLLASLKAIKTQINMIAKASKQLQSSMGAMNNAVKSAKTTMAGYGLSTKATVSAMKGAVGESAKFKQALSQLNSVAAKTKTGFDTAHSTLMRVEKAIHTTGQRMTAAGKNGKGFVDTANRMALVNQTLTGKLKTTSSGFQQVGTQVVKASASTKKATEQFHGFTKQISKVHGGLARVKAAFKVTASYGIAATAIYAVINAFKIGTQAIIDYDQALKNLQAITGATTAEVSAMGETIKDVARTTKFSTSEVAEGMVLLGQAGFDAGESMDAMQATANLATGTLSDMKLTTDLLTTTIRAFSLDTMEAGRVSDVMANAINKSKLTIDKLRISFNYIGATAAQAGVSLEETAATMMTLANNGLRASTIGTGMRQVLSRLIAPNSRLREAYEAQGVALDQVNPRTVGYQKVLENLTAILFDSETNAVNMAKAFELFGLRGAQAAAILVKGYVGGEFQVALNNVYEVGTAAKMSGIQQEGLGVKFKNLADRAKLVAVALGEGGVGGALGILTDMLMAVTIVMEAFATSAVGGVIMKVTLLVAVFAGLTMATKLLISSLKSLVIVKTITSGFALLSASMALSTVNSTAMAVAMGRLKIVIATLWATIRAHPFLAITTAVTTLLIILDQLAGSNEKLANELAVASVEARRMAEGINLYSDSLNALDSDSRDYQAVLERFQVTYPEVTKEILRMTKALDLADVATEDLTEAMDKLAAKRAWEALDNATRASEQYRIELGRSEVQFIRISELWPMIYHNLLGIGDAYDRNTNIQKALTEAQESQIHSLKTLVKTSELTIEQALERIEVMGLEKDAVEDLKDAFVNHFNRIALTSRDAVTQIKDVFAELPFHFGQVYGQLNAKDRALFIEMIAAMQRRVSAYRKNAKDMGVIEYEMQDQIAAIRQAAFDKFIEGKDKEVEKARKAAEKKVKAAQKAAEKELKIREEFNEKIIDLEQKIKDDINAIRESGLSEKALIKKREFEAHKAIEEAKKAITIANLKDATAAQKQAAIDAIEAARKAIGALRDVSKEAKSTSTELSASMGGSAKDLAADFKNLGTTMSSTMMESKKKVKDTNKEISDGSKKTTDELIRDWKNAKENVNREITGIEEKAGQLVIKWKEINDGVETFGGTIINRTRDMKGAAGEYVLELEKLLRELEKLKIEAEKDKDLKLNTEPAKKGVDEVNSVLGEVQEKAKTETVVTVLVDTAVANIQKVLDMLKTLVETTWESLHTIVVEGLEDLERVKFLHDNLKDRRTHSYHTVHVTEKTTKTGTTSQSSGGSVGGGGSSGNGNWVGPVMHSGGMAGGGRTMLERGEFVSDKTTVKAFGAGFFANLKTMASQVGGQMGGAGLHTINLNINNTPHTLYGDEQAVSGLVKSLRRAQLVTA